MQGKRAKGLMAMGNHRSPGMMKIAPLFLALALTAPSTIAAAEQAPLILEAKIPLGEVSGRIDHLAIDLRRQRLFVAELGNDSVGVVDLRQRKVLRTITGLSEPQGLAYVPSADMLYVADAGDGVVHLFRGDDLSPAGHIELGDDADNIRVDRRADKVLIGYGSGALAVIDPASRKKIADIPLKAHPEGFQIDPAGSRIFVNVPDSGEIAVVDAALGKQIAAWPLHDLRANFPMAIDDDGRRVVVVTRRPAKVVVLDVGTGGITAKLDTCGDADDAFIDAKRHRLYVSCGEGIIDILEEDGAPYHRIGHVPIASGARTSFFAPEMDRLFVGVRATASEAASIWVFRPTP